MQFLRTKLLTEEKDSENHPNMWTLNLPGVSIKKNQFEESI